MSDVDVDHTVDPNELIEVSDVQKRGDVFYDLRYLPERHKDKPYGKWEFSQEAFDALNLDNNALREYISKHGEVVFSVQDPEDSTFFRGRTGAENKGKLFTNQKLREHLDQIGHEDATHFALIPAGEEDGKEFYIVDAWGDRDLSPLLEERMEQPNN